MSRLYYIYLLVNKCLPRAKPYINTKVSIILCKQNDFVLVVGICT